LKEETIMVSLKINGKMFDVEEGLTILEVCKDIGVEIPTFCYDKRLVPYGGCRICIVEVKGAKTFQTACTTPVYKDMEIETHSEDVISARKDILNLIWASHDNDCLTCDKAGDCRLQDYCYEYEIEAEHSPYQKVMSGKIDKSNHFYQMNRDKCILCGRCIRTCSALQGLGSIGFSARGYHTHIAHPFEAGMEHSTCVSCGNCVNNCPTGALSERNRNKFRTWDIDKTVKTTCAYCGVGCQIDLKIKGNKILRVDPAADGVNQGLLCVKGKFAYNFVDHSDRLTTPLIRKDGKLVEATWDEAYDVIVSKMKEVKVHHGPDALAALSSARCSTEENYMLQKLFRAVVGTNNIDHCARL